MGVGPANQGCGRLLFEPSHLAHEFQSAFHRRLFTPRRDRQNSPGPLRGAQVALSSLAEGIFPLLQEIVCGRTTSVLNPSEFVRNRPRLTFGGDGLKSMSEFAQSLPYFMAPQSGRRRCDLDTVRIEFGSGVRTCVAGWGSSEEHPRGEH